MIRYSADPHYVIALNVHVQARSAGSQCAMCDRADQRMIAHCEHEIRHMCAMNADLPGYALIRDDPR